MIEQYYLNIEKKVISTNKTKNKIKSKFHIYINFLLVFILFSKFSSKNILKLRILNFFSQITLIMKEKGDQYIFSPEEGTLGFLGSIPDEIFVNGISQNIKGKIAYNLTKQENNITLKWYSSLKDCAHMFRSLTNLVKS